MPGAELDSYERYPQPRCLEGTRKALIKEIGAWMDQDHDRDMLWLYGPAGVGKSALAQTLGELAEKSRRLGAALFLSESGHGSDLSRLFVAIAHQLARRDPQYSVRVAEQLVADTGLLRKDLATQFRKLIIEPLSGLASLPKKLVVIIDGLDESKGEREQSEILRLIGKTLDSPQPLPLRWMICSRPEPHLQQTILKEFGIRCRWEVVPMDGRDIDLFIRDGFRRIIDTHSQAMESGEIWPREDDIAIIVRAASGLFIYASTIIRFIDDPDLAMPKSQLKVVLDFIQDSSIASSLSRTNPLKPLDTLYLQILSRVHASHLPTLLQLLGACALYPQLPVLELANLLNVTQEGFYAALRRVHSVIHVPSVDKASVDHLRFFHSSFVEFLKNPSRSQSFAFRPRDIHSGYAEACFRALGQTKVLYAKNLSWKARKPSALSLAHRILTYAAHHVWTACTNIGDLGNHPLFDLILDFNFTRLQFVEGKIPALHIRYFVRWLAIQVCPCRCLLRIY